MSKTPVNQTDPVNEAFADMRRVFIGVAGFSLFTSMLMLTGPLYMLQVYDRVLASSSVHTLIALTVLILVLYAGFAILDWVRNSILSRVGSRFEDTLGDRTLLATIKGRLEDPGRGSDKPIRDLRLLRRFLGSPAVTAMFDAPFSIMFLLIIFLIHWGYGLLTLGGGIILVGIAFLNQSMSKKTVRDAEILEGQAQARIMEISQNAEIIEALGLGERVRQKWRDEFDRSDAALVASSSLLGRFSSGTKAFRLFLQSSVLGLGAYLSIIGISTPGEMIAASILTGRAIGPLEQLVGQWRSVSSARAAWGALSEALRGKAPGREAMELPPVRGQIQVEGVSAGPPGATKPFLQQLNFQIEAGDFVGIIGPSAAGKSSLVRILVGIWSAQIGTVRIDGADISAWPREALGPQLGYLPQQVDLFSGRIHENIARFDPEATSEAVIAAAQAAGCHEMILRLEDGYDTEIGMRGAYLSAGQRQRIGLARALYGEPAIIVLDEPNSNLDSPGEVALQRAIAGLKARQATVIMIAHRPKSIGQCNKLLMLEGGRMRAYGPRDEVLAQVAPGNLAQPPSNPSPSDKAQNVVALPKGTEDVR